MLSLLPTNTRRSGEQAADVLAVQAAAEDAAAVEHAGEELGLALFQRQHLLLDRVLGDQPVDHHVPGLADPVRPVDCLGFGCRVPPRIEQEAVVGLSEVQPEPPALWLIRKTGAVPSLNRCSTAPRFLVLPSS